MSESVSFTAERKVTREEFMELAQNGMRDLMDIEQYKLVDGYKGEALSHFVYDTATHDCFLIDLRTAYELLALSLAGENKQQVLSSLKKIASSVS
ncbi:hypothetical protein [Alkalicoccus chagannorensis]|uniref:hypothetical protein n=1 Tax=Alkalicoccus chagannorensis TaxID=427072 RepID=UPI00047CE589|nr:hypothetical protein [Alkalicoccus chagannorensis]